MKKLRLGKLPNPFEDVNVENYILTHQELRQVFDAGNAGSGGSMYNRVRKYNGYDEFRDKNPEFFKAVQSNKQ